MVKETETDSNDLGILIPYTVGNMQFASNVRDMQMLGTVSIPVASCNKRNRTSARRKWSNSVYCNSGSETRNYLPNFNLKPEELEPAISSSTLVARAWTFQGLLCLNIAMEDPTFP